jgi:GNAT superfamily N-acetyltransferase
MFVDEKYRRTGVTKSLFSWLEAEFADNIVGFALQVSEENTAATQTVEKLGFKSPPISTSSVY